MSYIIFDLEWNNAYNYKTSKGMNEIIEIGAIKLDEKLNIIDTFKQLILPVLSKKLTGRFKTLTHITSEEIKESGIPFNDAFADFSRWCGNPDENIFMSWSNSDLYVLVDNFKKFKGTETIPFIKNYADAQKYCQNFLKIENNNQVSLANCAEKFDISIDKELHRALADCYLTAKCFEKVYDLKVFKNYVNVCEPEFFKRLVFKASYISAPVADGFILAEVFVDCPDCHKPLKVVKNYEFSNNTFRSIGVCKECKKKFWLYIRAKRTYDNVVISKKATVMNKKRAKKLDEII